MKRAATGLAALLLLALAGAATVERVGAQAIVAAPNAGRVFSTDELAVEVLDPPRPHATVFVLHGIRDHKESMEGWGGHLTGLGYRAVLVDSRGHGSSPGDYLTYGVREAQDLSHLLDRPGLVVGPVGVMGVSYGAATAIEWAGREPRVRAVVAVAPFESLRDVVPLYFRRMMPVVSLFVPRFVIERAVDRAGRLGGFDPDQASPLDAIEKIAAPVLLVHGTADVHIPASHSEALHQRAPRTRLVLVAGANHDTVPYAKELWPEAAALLAHGLDGN